MHKLLSLSTLLFIVFTLHANNFHCTAPSLFPPGLSVNCPLLSSNVTVYAIPDSTPVPKAGLLKKLAQALQFRKNARAREQARVLDIIARSGLKDSLQATARILDSLNTISADTTQEDIKEVLSAIDSLKRWLADSRSKSDSVKKSVRTYTPVDVPVDDQEIQDLVNQVVTPTDAKEPERLQSVRDLLSGKTPRVDTIRTSDTSGKVYTYRVRNKATIIGFFPYTERTTDSTPDLRLIDELSWYGVGFKGSSGDMTDFNGWDTSHLTSPAREKKYRITLCVGSEKQSNILALLSNKGHQRILISDIVTELSRRGAAGVNIQFDHLPHNSRSDFTAFIISLAEALKAPGLHYRLGIRIPADDQAEAYDLKTLKEWADQLLVDFTQYDAAEEPGPLAPLGGSRNDDLKTCISRYLNMDIPPSKIIVCLPYYGVQWTVNPGQQTFKGVPDYIEYKDLRSKYLKGQTPVYDPVAASERLDVRDKAGKLTERIWYDDEKTLAAKYDFILQNGLGGIAIQSLGYDEGHGELWDVLASKFAEVDTAVTELKSRQKAKVLDDWQWSLPYIGAKIEQYDFLFAYPCETKFPKVLVTKWEQAGVKNNDREGIREEATSVLGILSLLFFVLFASGVLLFINKIRRVGDRWTWAKPLAAVLIFLFILFTITGFMFLFLNKHVSFFGASDSPGGCYDFPLGILFLVIFTGIAIGALITRAFVFRLIKKDDIP
jgi:Glycosyl hydrolases family 18